MQKRMLKVLIVFILIMTMTMSNFLLIGINVVNAVEQNVQDKNTSHKNIEFMAYFKDEQGNHVSNCSLKTTDADTKLYLAVSVKQEGYFNGTINLKDSNFKFKTDNASDKVSSITENSVTLHQINANDSVEIEMSVETIKDSSYNINLINQESVLELSGIYRDSKQKDIKVTGTKKVNLRMASPYTKENNGIFLKQTVLTNKVLNYQGNHRVVQLQIETGLKDNMYPVKTETVELQAPMLNGAYPESMYVQTPEALATNSLKLIDNSQDEIKYTYDNKTGKLAVTVQNPEKDGKVVWNKSGEDRYIVTYVFSDTSQIDEQSLKADAKISLYDIEKTVMSYSSEITLPSEEIDSIVNVDIKNQEDEIYKGKLYSKIDKEITEKINIQVNLENITDKISVQEDYTNMGLSNIYTKNIVLNKANLLEILGQDGSLKIIDKNIKTVLADINKDSQSDENQNISVVLPDTTKEIIVETTKPVKSGILPIQTTKVIKANDISKIKSISEMQYFVHASYYIGDAENKISDSSSKIILKETQTTATLNINKTEFSAMRTNENVELRVTLNSNSEKDELYKDPHVVVTLPKEFENIDVTSIKLLNDDNLKITSAKLNGNSIDIQIDGEQTEYKGEAIDGATILMTMNLTTNKKQKNADEKIVVDYTNKKVINYAGGQNVGRIEGDIKIVSYAGVITTNGIKDYGIETINNDGSKDGKLALASEAKTTTVTSEVLNNQETVMSNVRILGSFPTKDALSENNLSTTVQELQISGIDASKIKVYYSENANATADISNSTNAWQEKIDNNSNVKKYLIAVSSLDVSEDMNIAYKMTIPANLEYNATAAEEYTVYYVDSNNIEQTVQVQKMTLSTGKGPSVDTTLKALIGGKELEEAKEGEKIQYTITAKNSGSEKVENLTLVGSVPDGTVYIEEVTPSTEMDDKPQEKKFNEIEDQKEVKFTGIALEPGQEISKTYMVKIKDGASEKKTVSNKIEVQYGEAKKESNLVKTNIVKGKIEISLSPAEATDTVKPGYQYRYVVTVKNTTNKEIKNIKLQFELENFSISQILATNSDGDLQYIENTDNYTINKLGAGETSEVSIYARVNMFTDAKNKQAKINVTAKIDNEEYHSNQKEMTAVAQIVNISNKSENAGQYVKAGDEISYQITVSNDGQDPITSVNIKDNLSSYESLLSITSDGQELSTQSYTENTDEDSGVTNITINEQLQPGQTKNYVIKSAIDSDAENDQAVELSNTAAAYAYDVETGKSEVSHILEPTKSTDIDGDVTGDDDTIDSGNKTNSDENNSKSDGSQTQEDLKIISGIAWLDKDGNGQKDDGEDLLQGIKVRLFNTEKNEYQKNNKNQEIVATTNDNGFYTLADVPQGKYIVVFEYDNSKYALTAYEKDGVAESKNSKVISKEMKIDGTDKEVGVTEEFTVKDGHISNMNIGLKERKIYDMKLEKMVTRVVVQNSKTTRAVEYQDATLAKVDLDSKQLSNTSVVVEYKIKVTNDGEVAGYIKKIQDYVSSDFKFSSELNKDWYQSGSDLYNNSLANVKLEPGQSKEITLILTKQMTENNTGLINNTAEIAESYNEQGLKDNDSTEGNRVKGEDDMGSADLILSIKTGQVVETILVILSTIIIIGAGAYIITRKVLNKKVI